MKKMIALSLAIFCALCLRAQQQPKPPENNTPKFPAASTYANAKLSYKVIDAPNHTYGYDVLADGRLMIHQSSAPGLPGNEGFKSRAYAGKVAQLVINKIKKGEMPPTVTIEEMKKLKVIQ